MAKEKTQKGIYVEIGDGCFLTAYFGKSEFFRWSRNLTDGEGDCLGIRTEGMHFYLPFPYALFVAFLGRERLETAWGGIRILKI